MKLHGYFRSAAAYRVRIALNLKGVPTDHLPHHLRKGEQCAPAYLAINPQGLVPTLEGDDGAVLTQSLAIIEWLDETHPDPPLLPNDPLRRAKVRAFAMALACDTHPVQNLKVLTRLRQLGWGPWSIILSSAALRGAYHAYQGFGPIVGNFVMGIVFGWAYQRWGRVMPLVIAHTVLDVVAFVGYPLAASLWPGVFGPVPGPSGSPSPTPTP